MDNSILNLAAIVAATNVLGPGLRFGIWVQGCPFSCPGCISPDWITRKPNQIISISDMASMILDSHTTGLTISGGEPFLQRDALAVLIERVRKTRAIDVIVFTGYKYSQLQRLSQAEKLLQQIDLLIDGSYIAERNIDVGLRGSDNQQLLFLSNRLKNIDFPFENYSRKIELHFQGDNLLIVGIPKRSDLAMIDSALEKAKSSMNLDFNIPISKWDRQYERP